MAVYTSARSYTRNYNGSRIRHLSGYIRPSQTAYDMYEVSGILASDGTTDDVLSDVLGTSLVIPGEAGNLEPSSFITSASANASIGGRINFNYTKLYKEANAPGLPTASGTEIAEYCGEGEWSGNLNISYDGPSCDKLRITGASGSLTTIAHSGVSADVDPDGITPTTLGDHDVVNNFKYWLEQQVDYVSIDTVEEGTEYDPAEGEKAFKRYDVFDADDQGLPGEWFSMSAVT